MRTYRACYATYPGGGIVRLTSPEHADLPDTALLEEAEREAARQLRPEDRAGEVLVIGEWTER